MGRPQIRDSETFVRLVVTVGHASVLVDLALDATAERPGTTSIAGPTLDPVDLAGRKVIALFDRAEARDFADVYVLAARYGQQRLLELAGTVDAGFDQIIFADMLDSLARFVDDEIPSRAPKSRRFEPSSPNGAETYGWQGQWLTTDQVSPNPGAGRRGMSCGMADRVRAGRRVRTERQVVR